LFICNITKPGFGCLYVSYVVVSSGLLVHIWFLFC